MNADIFFSAVPMGLPPTVIWIIFFLFPELPLRTFLETGSDRMKLNASRQINCFSSDRDLHSLELRFSLQGLVIYRKLSDKFLEISSNASRSRRKASPSLLAKFNLTTEDTTNDKGINVTLTPTMRHNGTTVSCVAKSVSHQAILFVIESCCHQTNTVHPCSFQTRAKRASKRKRCRWFGILQFERWRLLMVLSSLKTRE